MCMAQLTSSCGAALRHTQGYRPAFALCPNGRALRALCAPHQLAFPARAHVPYQHYAKNRRTGSLWLFLLPASNDWWIFAKTQVIVTLMYFSCLCRTLHLFLHRKKILMTAKIFHIFVFCWKITEKWKKNTLSSALEWWTRVNLRDHSARKIRKHKAPLPWSTKSKEEERGKRD